jgi:hypothetical protein
MQKKHLTKSNIHCDLTKQIGQGVYLVVEHLPNMYKALALIPNTARINK